MEYVILIIATLASTGKAIFCKLVGGTSGRESFLINFKSFSVSFAVALIFAAKELPKIGTVSLFSFLLAIIFGFIVAFTQFAQMKAMSSGPASITTLIYSSAFLIPIIFSCFVWSEPISVFQMIGILVLVVAIFLIVIEPGGGKINKLWLVYVIMASLASGTLAILQKIHQHSEHRAELKLFLVLALFFSAFFYLILYLIYPKITKASTGNSTVSNPEKESEAKRSTSSKASETPEKKHTGVLKTLTLLSPIFLGTAVGCLNFLNLMLAGMLPSAIQFPVYNIGSLILTSIVSVIVFKERLAARRLVGYAIGIAAILVIGLL